MVAKLVTVGEGDAAYSVLMEVDEDTASEEDDTKADKLPYAEANSMTKAQLVEYVSLPVEGDEEESGGTEDA
jgi:hypothetical protein